MDHYKSETIKHGLVFKDMTASIKSLKDLLKLTGVVAKVADKTKVYAIFNTPVVLEYINLINFFGSVKTFIKADDEEVCLLLRSDEYYYSPLTTPNQLTLIKFLTDNENCLCNICLDDGKDHLLTCEKCQYQICKECLIKCLFICPICKKTHIKN